MKRKKKSSIGCLFWVALILLLIVIFLLSRSRIESVLEATGFKDILKKNTNITTPLIIQNTNNRKKSLKNNSESNTPPQKQNTKSNTKMVPEVTININESKDNTKVLKEVYSQKKERTSVLYFILVSNNGSISLRKVQRTIFFIDSPLTETIKSLIKGLTPSELNHGLISLIPDKTKLLGISIKGATAYINFNDSVKFNSFGEEGLAASLKQIVYTATEFKTVSNVQILINGKKEKYLSTEGVFVGKPLSRDSFK